MTNVIRVIFAFFGGIFSWLTIAVFAGALTVGAVFWMYSGDLPKHEQLAQYSPPTISRIYSGEGRLMDEFAKERRLFTPIEDIPDLVKNAFISAEDKNFYTHVGYDPMGIAKAGFDALTGKRLRGASTITQQVMKNFLLDGDRSAERKVKEILLAARLEETLTKDQILELYLNEIELGKRSFGVTAAAQTYFNKILSELTTEEVAYLAILPKAPYGYDPVKQKDKAIARRNFVLKEMFENGYIDQAEYTRAKATDLKTVQSGDFVSFRKSLPPRDYFTREIERQLSDQFGEDQFFTEGLSIRATMDPTLQQAAAKSLRRGLERYDRGIGVWRGTGETLPAEVLGNEADWRKALSDLRMPRDIDGWYLAVALAEGETHLRIGIEGIEEDADGHWIPPNDATWARPRLENGKLGKKARKASDLVDVGDVVFVRKVTKNGAFVRWSLRQIPEVSGGFMAMDVNTGRVLAMQGGFSYQHSSFNRTTQAQRQPGSAFKPFVYAAALDSGYTPATIVVDAPIEVNTPQGLWRPKNASKRFYGPTPLRTGIEQSRNLMTVRLAQEVGMDVVAGYAEKFRVYKNMNRFLSNSLGSQETSLFNIVAAYAMFANGGERVEPTLVDRVQDRRGRTLYRHERRVCNDCQLASLTSGRAPAIISNRERVMDPITAYQLTSMMQGVVDRGTAKKTVKLPVPIAGKTGTTNDAKDVWFVGFSSNIVAGCFIGHNTPRSMGKGASGGGMCGPVFNSFMQTAVKEYGGGKFAVPSGGYFIKIDRFTGQRLPDDATGDNVVAEYFRDGDEPFMGLIATIDGGFAMGSDLPLFNSAAVPELTVKEVVTSTGQTKKIGGKASFGSLSSGGLY